MADDAAIAAKKDNPYAHLRSVGISLPDDATLPDVTAGITDALDRAVEDSRRRSDLAEISGRALVGAVADALQSAPALGRVRSPPSQKQGMGGV